MCDDGNSVFQAKNNICIAKFGNLGANGVKGSEFLVNNFYGATMLLKGT